MSLDIAVLDDEEHVVRSVPIGVDEHAAFMEIVNRKGPTVLGRLSDYYEEAEIFPPEFDDLHTELSVATSECSRSSALHRTLLEFRELLSFAEEQSRSLVALPD